MANDRTHVKLRPTVNDAGASVEVGKTGSLMSVTSGMDSQAIALDEGANPITVKVTASDGNATKTYTVTVTRAEAPNPPAAPAAPTLVPGDTQIAVSWTAPDDGGATIFEYDVEYKETAAPDSFAGSNDPADGWAATPVTSTMVTLTGLKNGTSYDVRVRAANIAGQGDWSPVARATPTEAPSNDATLSGLTATTSDGATGTFASQALTPAFDAATVAYSASVANSVTHVKLRPTVNDAGASVEVGKTGSLMSVTSGTESQAIALNEGANPITVKVTAADMNTSKTYTVTVTRAAPLPVPENLTVTRGAHTDGTPKLTVSADVPATIDPFHYVVYQFKSASALSWPARSTSTVAGLPPGVSLVSGATDEYSGFAPGTAYDVRAHLVDGTDSLNIHAVAASTTPVRVTTWDVPGAPTSVSAQAGDAKLDVTWIAPTNVGGTGSDAPTITGYKVRWRVKDTGSGSPGSWNANGDGVDADSTSTHAITSLTNDTTYEVEVRALNGINPGSAWSAAADGTPQSSDATLSGLTATSATSSSGPFASLDIGTFAAATTSYTANVANDVTHVKLTPTVNDAGASVEVGKKGQTLATVSSGTASAAIALEAGAANPITVKVTAQDGTTTETYTVTVNRAAATTVLGITVTSPSREYGGTDDLSFTVSGLATGDPQASVLSGALAREAGDDAGTYAIGLGTLAIQSAFQSKYALPEASTLGNYEITPKTVTVASATLTKTYDGTTSASGATLSGGAVSGEEGSDSLTLSISGGDYDTKDAGTGKTVSGHTLGLTAGSGSAANYRLPATVSLSGVIEKAELSSITGVTVDTKAEDGTTTATFDTSQATATGLVSGEQSDFRSGGLQVSGAFPSAGVGTHSVSVTYTLQDQGGFKADNLRVRVRSGQRHAERRD